MLDPETLKNALSNLFSRLIDFPPRLLLTLFVLGIGYLCARFAKQAITRLADRLKLDALLDGIGLGETVRKISPQGGSGLIGTFFFWLLFLNFVLVATDILQVQAVTEMLQNLVGYLPRLASALLVVVFGFFAAQSIRTIAQSGLQNMGVEFHETLSGVIYLLLVVITCIVAVGQAGFQIELLAATFTNLVTIIAAGAALAFALGGRDIAHNVLAGFYARDQFLPGDEITLGTESGVLLGIGSLNAEVKTENGVVVIPNAQLVNQRVKIHRNV